MELGQFKTKVVFLESLEPRPWTMEGRSGVTYRVRVDFDGGSLSAKVTAEVHKAFTSMRRYTEVEVIGNLDVTREGHPSFVFTSVSSAPSQVNGPSPVVQANRAS